MQHDIPDHKVCPRCNEDKPSTEYYVNSSRTDGLTYYCKICVVAYAKEPRKGTRKNIAASKKQCCNCKRVLPAAAFTYSQQTTDRLRPDCRSCRMYRKKNPTLDQVLELENEMYHIYRAGSIQVGDIDHHRSEFEQFVYKQMLIRGLLDDWKPPIWIHASSIPE